MNCQTCGHENVEEARFCASCGAALASGVESQHDPLIGQVIGNRYRITGVIGEGGMGVVYVGEQQMGSTVRKVAVKTLHAHLCKDANILKRFHRECGTVAQLEHPNTIKVYDFGSTPDGTLYIAMEYVAGHSLSDVLLSDGPLSSQRVVQILRQICGALDEAHQLGIIHRDLKPDNIILTPRAGEQDFVKILDFGIAARTESADAAHEQKLTQQGTVLGTPPYMSPEQFTGKPLDRRSDVYSLGVMVYEMLTGKLPFDAETPWQWATQHMTAQPKSFEMTAPQIQIAVGMRQTILRALSKDREDRQASAGQFFSELSAGLKTGVEGTPAVAAALALPSQATAAMPELATGSLATSPAGLSAAQAATPPTAAIAAVAPALVAAPIAAPKFRTAGRLGLVLGLSITGVAIAAIMGVVYVRSNQAKDDLGVAAPSIATSSLVPSAQATAAAEIPKESASSAPAAQPPTEATPARDSSSRKIASKTPTPTRTAAQNAEVTPEQPAATSAKPQSPSNPMQVHTPVQQSPAACDSCVNAATNGDLNSAARFLGGCTDPEGRARCVGRARTGAVGAARAAMMNRDCARVRSIADAANTMGAGSIALSNAANYCR